MHKLGVRGELLQIHFDVDSKTAAPFFATRTTIRCAHVLVQSVNNWAIYRLKNPTATAASSFSEKIIDDPFIY